MSTIKQVNIQTPLGETLSKDIGADALNIDYDNSSSELESTNVQDAIDELKDDLSNLSSTLEDLDDVNLSNLQNEQVIKYNSTSQKWENGNVNISGKADKVSNATNGNFASLDANGNLTDSGKKASDFAGTGTATSSTNGLMSSTDKTKLDNLGTASTKDVPTSGNAGSTQVVMGNDTRLSDSRKASDVYDWAKAATKPTYTASEVGAIASTTKGANNGVAELDSTGKVPSSQLPSFVDDVLEYNSLSAFPATGEAGKIYIAKDTNKTYRWSGTVYAEVSPSLALGETSSTAYRGDRGKIAYDHSQSTHARTDATKVEASSTNGKIKINGTETTVYTHPGSGTNPHGTTKSDVGLGNVGNFKAVSTVASQGLSDTEKANARANIGAGTGNSNLTLGTSSTTAYRGDYGNSAYAHAVTNKGAAFSSGLYKITTNSEGHVTAATAVAKADITGLGIPGSDTNTHRPIQVNGTEILGNNTTALNLKAGSNVSVTNSSGTVTIAATDTKYTAATAAPGDITTGTASAGSSANYARQDHTHKIATASTSAYGVTKLNDATNSTSTTEAATANAVKKAYDLANGKASSSHTHSADNIVGGYLNIHPENGPTLIPFMNNDIAFLLKRGGSAIVKYDGTTKSLDLTSCFDASPSYFAVDPTGVTTITIELTLHKTFTWTNTIYVDFGASGWRAKNVKIEVMNSNYSGDTWTQKYNNTNNNSGHCYVSMGHQPVGSSNTGGGFNKVRFTFSGWASATIFRIAQLGIYNYGSLGLRETFLPKDGGNLYGSIYPNSNNGANLGSTSNYWSNAYITNINGVAVGSSPKFTDHYAWNDITGKPSSFTPASHTHNYAGSSSAGGAASSVANSLTFNNGGSGAASGTTFNGSAAKTISYNTIGAAASSHNQASNTINAMTGYSKPSSTSAIATSDSLNAAIGKLEKALDAKGTGTVTQVKVGSTAYNPNSGVISLPAYPTVPDVSTKMNKSNPTGTGSFSLNRKASTTIGNYSFAEGSNTVASGEASHAEGLETVASSVYSHAEGVGTFASGDESHAEGLETTARGIASHAEGVKTCAVGDSSHSEGCAPRAGQIIAIGEGSHAEGHGETKIIAYGKGSHAEGSGTTAYGSYSHAEGYKTCAAGADSHAEGYTTTASNNYAHAEGNNVTASGICSHAEGDNTLASGEEAHAEGNSTLASGAYSHAEGDQPTAQGAGSHAEGCDTLAKGNHSHAEGETTYAYGENSHAEGNATSALNASSHAEGGSTIASGNYSHAEGNKSYAKGADSHAEGGTTTALSGGAHAEGANTLASGGYSHAEGAQTTASGAFSHAEGNCTLANNSYSHSAGYKGTAYSNNTYYRDTTIISAESIQFAFGTDAQATPTSANFMDPNSYNAFSIDNQGSIFAKGAMGISRGYINGTLVANGPRIVLEDGASYMLYTDTRNKSTGAWRGAQAYYIAGSWNPLGTGSSTTALAVPHAASLGAVGSCGVKLQLDTVAYTNNGTKYRGQLGIGSCGTGYGVRWNLVKVVGSDADFGY